MKKKNVWIIGCLLVALCIFFTPQISRIHADSGFDSDWGGGSSSSSSDSSSSSGGGSYFDYEIGPVGLFLFLAFIYGTTIPLIFYNIYKDIRKKREQKRNPRQNKDARSISEADREFVSKAFDIYKTIQIAWMNFDEELLRQNTTDELYNMYLSQLDTLKVKNQQNIMRDFQLRGGYVASSIKDENGMETITIILTVLCKDYLIEQATKQVLRGNKKATMEYQYELTFIKKKNEKKNEEICPNCGAPIKGNASTRCEYCNSVILKDNYDLVMSKKRMIHQRRI